MFLLRSPTFFLSPPTSFFLRKSITRINPSISFRTFTTTPSFNMPQPLKASEVESKTDPSVAKQWDDETPKKEQIEDFYKTVDGLKVGLLTTIRDGIGPVSRSMAIAKVRPLHTYPLTHRRPRSLHPRHVMKIQDEEAS